MVRRFHTVPLIAFLAGLIPCIAIINPPLEAQSPADIVLHNGKILTADASFSTA